MSDRTIEDYNLYDPPNDWPEEWPTLSASEINQDGFYFKSYVNKEGKILNVDKNCACLEGWAINVTSNANLRCSICIKIQNTIYELFDIKSDDYNSYYGVPYLNDKFLTKKQCAEIWNEVGRRLGYTED